MSAEDLAELLGGGMRSYMEQIIDSYVILIFYMADGEDFTVGAGGARKSNVRCLEHAVEVQYDSHKTDYLYNNIVRIDKYG